MIVRNYSLNVYAITSTSVKKYSVFYVFFIKVQSIDSSNLERFAGLDET